MTRSGTASTVGARPGQPAGRGSTASSRIDPTMPGAVFPIIRDAAVENRFFLQRVVTYLVREAGLGQFLDIGTGLPAANNTHQVAQSIAPACCIAYVDNDPIVLAHAHALMTSSREGATTYIDADLREPATILDHPQLRDTLDLSQPVALLLIAILQFIADRHDPHGIVATLTAAMPAGSYLAISHPTFDGLTSHTVNQLTALAAKPGGGFHPRTRAEVARFFTGTQTVPPGLTSIVDWRADEEPRPRISAADTAVYGAVARML